MINICPGIDIKSQKFSYYHTKIEDTFSTQTRLFVLYVVVCQLDTCLKACKLRMSCQLFLAQIGRIKLYRYAQYSFIGKRMASIYFLPARTKYALNAKSTNNGSNNPHFFISYIVKELKLLIIFSSPSFPIN